MRGRGPRIRLPAAGAHPSRFTCPNLPRLVAYSASCLPTSLLRLHFRALVRLCATDNDRCTNTAALQTDPPTAWRGSQPSRHRGFIAPSRLAFVSFRFFVGSVCRQPEPTLRVSPAPTSRASSHTRQAACPRRCFGCISALSSDSALRTTHRCSKHGCLADGSIFRMGRRGERSRHPGTIVPIASS